MLGFDGLRAVIYEGSSTKSVDNVSLLLGVEDDYPWIMANDRRQYILIRLFETDPDDDGWHTIEQSKLTTRWEPQLLAVPPTKHPSFGAMKFVNGTPEDTPAPLYEPEPDARPAFNLSDAPWANPLLSDVDEPDEGGQTNLDDGGDDANAGNFSELSPEEECESLFGEDPKTPQTHKEQTTKHTRETIVSPRNLTDGGKNPLENTDLTDGGKTPSQPPEDEVSDSTGDKPFTDDVIKPFTDNVMSLEADGTGDGHTSNGVDIHVDPDQDADPALARRGANETETADTETADEVEAGDDSFNDRSAPPMRSVAADVLMMRTKDRIPEVPYIRVPRKFRDALLNDYEKYKLFEEHEGLFAFFQLAVFGVQAGTRGGVVADQSTVYDAFGVTANENISAADLIGMYRAKVEQNIDVLPYHSNRLAREIRNHPLPPDLANMREQFIMHPESFDDWVYLMDGRTANATNRKTITGRRIEEANGYEPVIQPPPETLKIQEYMNGLSPKLFESVTERIPDARKAVREEDLFETEEARLVTLQRLIQVETCPKPVYKTADYSPRLYPHGENTLPNLKSALRPILYTDRDVELDLSKAHLAIFAKMAREAGINTSVIDSYLDDHMGGRIDLWTELASSLDLPDEKAARRAVKRIYAAVYGGDEREVLRRVSNEYADQARVEHPGFDSFKPLLDHPFVEAVMNVREGILNGIAAKGGMDDATGRRLDLGEFSARDNSDRSLMSYVASTYEVKLIAAAIAQARKEMERSEWRFQIWLLQHDGFTIRVSRPRYKKKAIQEMKQAVANAARDLNIDTRLERALDKS